ncbi:MAG: hypothetical protein CM1200mP29_09420 [Verrucomicrobiota bacterium]|nr:MAG: hypothetical protein CM1200mP29_09420 [Verrucomicrobiota bacterium]
MEEAMAQSQTSFAAGQIVKGTVIEIRQKEVMIDIGYKSEGSVPVNEFEDHDEEELNWGTWWMCKSCDSRTPTAWSSFPEQAIFKQNLGQHQNHLEEGGHIKGPVKAAVKGGLIVNIGVEAFLPSRRSTSPPRAIWSLRRPDLRFQGDEAQSRAAKIVLSRREFIEEERSTKRAELLNDMVPGDIRKGTVKNLTDFGAFVDLNGLEVSAHHRHELGPHHASLADVGCWPGT